MRSIAYGIAAATLVPAGALAQAPAPAAFVADAGASDKFEIESARLMITSKNPQIAAFANKMIADHGKSTRMVTAAAKADHLAPKPPTLSLKQRADITALKAVPAGKTKDDLYVKQQKAAHGDALNLMQTYASSGTATHLKLAAKQVAPVVKMHAAKLDTL